MLLRNHQNVIIGATMDGNARPHHSLNAIEWKTKNMKIDIYRILDSIDQYVYCKDKAGVYVYGNEQFAHVAGLKHQKDLIGKSDRDLVWKNDFTDIEENDRTVLHGKTLSRYETIQTRKNGRVKIVLTQKPFYSDNGEIVGTIGNFFDIENSLILRTKGRFDEKKKRLHLGYTPQWLSFAEVKICFYLIHGFSAPKISDKTGITVSTVRYHIENIKDKMQCTNKGDIPAVAMKTGIAWKILSLQHVGELDSEK